MPDDFGAARPFLERKAFILSYSGKKIGLGLPPPPIEDIAVSLGRLCRFTGHCRRWYPVLLHSMVVADLTLGCTRGGLLHDSAECYLGDVPTPFKTPELKALELRLLMPILSKYLLPEEQEDWVDGGYKLVKAADEEVFSAEVYLLGCEGLVEYAGDRYPETESLVQEYIDRYPVEECLNPSGTAVIEFIRRARL